VCVTEITHVDVVAHTSAIVCGIVVAEDSDVVELFLCHLQHERDQVCLGIVAFTPIGTRARRIEVTQSNELQIVRAVIVCENAFDEQLGPSIRIRRLLRVCFVDRNLLRLAVGRSG